MFDMGFISKYAHMYVSAAGLTLRIAFFGIIFSLILGAFCSMVQYFKIPVIRRIVGVYIELSRNTPLLVQLYFIYYGLPKIGISLSGEMCAIIGLIFLGGSYMSEAFRSSRAQTMRYIVFPQALATSVPALCANIIFMIKETSVVSAIAVVDLMYVAKDLIGLYYDTGEALLMLVIAYLLILLPISIIATLLERRMRYAGFGN